MGTVQEPPVGGTDKCTNLCQARESKGEAGHLKRASCTPVDQTMYQTPWCVGVGGVCWGVGGGGGGGLSFGEVCVHGGGLCFGAWMAGRLCFVCLSPLPLVVP